MNSNEREQWGSKVGFLLAAAGSIRICIFRNTYNPWIYIDGWRINIR